MTDFRIGVIGALATVALGIAAPSVSQAATVSLNYDGSPNAYCSNACLTATYPTAGTVSVTVDTSGANSFLHFVVDLANGFTFVNNHGLAFGWGMNVTGATVSGFAADVSPESAWLPLLNGIDAGDGVGEPFGYGFDGTFKIDNMIAFDVKKIGTNLTLANLATTDDKHGVALWFIADIANPAGVTGYVAARGSDTPELRDAPGSTPVPGAAFLMGSILAGGAGFGAWRRRRNKLAA